MNKKITKIIPDNLSDYDSLQLSLFKNFITNDPKDLSNTVEAWETIPKYFFTTALMERLRNTTGHADPYKWEYFYNDKTYTAMVQPALLEQEDGKFKAFFPSATEEMIEEVLKKLFVEQQGFHDQKKIESWIWFSLRMIQKELKNRGRDRNITQIKHSLDIMTGTIITISQGKQEIYKGPILSDLMTVDREEYIQGTDQKCFCKLPTLLSVGINTQEYRQYNYGRFMTLDAQLSRWVYKKLVNRFKQASITTSYHTLYSSISRDSGLLQDSKAQNNRVRILSALEELKANQVLKDFVAEETKKGNKIIDIKYTLTCTQEFIKEQKAANMRETTHKKITSPQLLVALNSGSNSK